MMRDKAKKFFSSIGLDDHFFVLIMIVALLIRMSAFVYPHYYEDANRDYLIAHHILAFHEFPLNGPFGQLPNSPLYYYIVAGILLIFDNFLFLNYVNIALQLVFLWGVYKVAKDFFGKTSGRIAVLFGAVSNIAVNQSLSMWMPHLMQVFLILSFAALSTAYHKRSYATACGGVILFVIAGLVYNPVFAMLPAMIVAMIFILKRFAYSLRQMIARAVLLSLIALDMMLIAYLPLFMTWSNVLSYRGFSRASFLFGVSFQELIRRAGERGLMLMHMIFANTHGLLFVAVCGLLILCVIMYYGSAPRMTMQKKHLLFLTACCLSFFLIIPLINAPGIAFPLRYFTPLFGLFFVIIAEVIHTAFFGDSLHRIAARFAIIGCMTAAIATPSLLASSLFDYELATVSMRLSAAMLSVRSAELSIPSNPALTAIIGEIAAIQKREHRMQPNFFQFDSYFNGKKYPYVDGVFWSPLEKHLSQKLVQVDDSDIRGFRPLTTDDYIFLICAYKGQQEAAHKECEDTFLGIRSDYVIEKSVYVQSPYTIFLARKKSSVAFQKSWGVLAFSYW